MLLVVVGAVGSVPWEARYEGGGTFWWGKVGTVHLGQVDLSPVVMAGAVRMS